MPTEKCKWVWIALVVYTALAVVMFWGLLSGHALVGIGIGVLVTLVPSIAVLPSSIRSSRRRAEAARARREGR